MSTDWEQLKGLFDAFIAAEPRHRQALLDALDPGLREELESLIASHGSDSVLEKPPPDAASLGIETLEGATAMRASHLDEAPQQIGPYRILQELGTGGMGVVFEAEQEKPVRRKVALKLVKLGMDTKEVIARFESERQALALMNHRNVASVYDVGASENGRPFFTMELVKGVPITEYCDAQRLNLKERLELFVQVCDGVQHAHHKGIIHRDLKPSNVLVTVHDERPVPKIIDFGIAKATSQRLTERTLYTQLGQMVGTPEYMSPEQAEMSGLDVDTRTDVYSLGVLLYELLVGAHPLDAQELRQSSFDDMRRRIREQDPPPPSTKLKALGDTSGATAMNRRVELPTLERALRGDLDWITMKALEKDRTRRYSSPNELAADIGRHLRYEPVLARPPSTAYRARKFIRRHKVGVGVAAGFVVLLIGVAVLTTVQSIRIARERDRAEREAAKAIAINEFLQETLSSADPFADLGRDVSVVEALGQAVRRIEGAFDDQPEIEAAVKSTIAQAYWQLGRSEEAEALFASALQIRREIFGTEHLDVAETLLHLGGLWVERGDFALGESYLDEALRIRRELLGAESPEVAEALTGLAMLRNRMSEYDEAERLLGESVDMLRSLGEEEAVAGTLNGLGMTLQSQGRIDEAEELYLESLDIAREREVHNLVVTLSNNLALLYRDRGDFDAAEKYMRESLAAQREFVGDEHPSIAVALFNLASVLNENGAYAAAESLAREALARAREQNPPGHWRTGTALRVLADALTGLGALEEAEQKYVEAIGIFEESLGAETPRTAHARRGYGTVLIETERFAAAEKELLFALPFYRDAFGEDAPRTRSVVRDLVELYERWGKPEKAAEYGLVGEVRERPGQRGI